MARLARFVIPGCPHHVTQCRNNCQAVFFSDSDRDSLVQGMEADELDRIRTATKVSRPLGNEEFITKIEELTIRSINLANQEENGVRLNRRYFEFGSQAAYLRVASSQFRIRERSRFIEDRLSHDLHLRTGNCIYSRCQCAKTNLSSGA
jgi:hypothetical protein